MASGCVPGSGGRLDILVKGCLNILPVIPKMVNN